MPAFNLIIIFVMSFLFVIAFIKRLLWLGAIVLTIGILSYFGILESAWTAIQSFLLNHNDQTGRILISMVKYCNLLSGLI